MEVRDENKDFFLNLYKNIVKTEEGYILQKAYEEDESGKIKETIESKENPNNNGFSKNCNLCIHNHNGDCKFRTKLENLPENHVIPSHWTYKCDAYEPIESLNMIKSEKEMIDFIEKTKNFFDCVEDYESYYGFERKWDESTGDILETVEEYYNRGGKFTNIPTEYPCVIYFDFGRNKLEWIAI